MTKVPEPTVRTPVQVHVIRTTEREQSLVRALRLLLRSVAALPEALRLGACDVVFDWHRVPPSLSERESLAPFECALAHERSCPPRSRTSRCRSPTHRRVVAPGTRDRPPARRAAHRRRRTRGRRGRGRCVDTPPCHSTHWAAWARSHSIASRYSIGFPIIVEC